MPGRGILCTWVKRTLSVWLTLHQVPRASTHCRHHLLWILLLLIVLATRLLSLEWDIFKHFIRLIQILRSPDGFVAITTLLTQSVGASIGAITHNFMSFSSSCLSLGFSAKGTRLEGDINYLVIFQDWLLIAELLGGFLSLLQRHLDTPWWVGQGSSTCMLRSSTLWRLLPAQNFLGVFRGVPCVGWLLLLEVGLTSPSRRQTLRNISCHSLDFRSWHLPLQFRFIPHW